MDARVTADGWRLDLLGGFALVVEGRQLLVSHAGQRLLALLAVRGPSHRSTVAGTLWPEASEKRAAGNLRSVRWRLPWPDAVISRGAELALHPELTVDLTVRLLASAQSVPDHAPSDLATELLPGWDEPWLDLPREQLRESGLQALERRGVALLADGHLLDALTCATRAIGVDPLREPAYRLLVQVHLAEGNPAAALRVGRDYAQLLERELGLGPSGQMLALLRQLPRPRDAAVTFA